MNNEVPFLIKKQTATLVEQKKTKPQETLEFKMNKQMQTFSFIPSILLFEEGKWFWQCFHSSVQTLFLI